MIWKCLWIKQVHQSLQMTVIPLLNNHAFPYREPWTWKPHFAYTQRFVYIHKCVCGKQIMFSVATLNRGSQGQTYRAVYDCRNHHWLLLCVGFIAGEEGESIMLLSQWWQTHGPKDWQQIPEAKEYHKIEACRYLKSGNITFCISHSNLLFFFFFKLSNPCILEEKKNKIAERNLYKS